MFFIFLKFKVLLDFINELFGRLEVELSLSIEDDSFFRICFWLWFFFEFEENCIFVVCGKKKNDERCLEDNEN